MECLNTETLNMHLDNALEAEARAAVTAHLGTCQRCTDKLRMLQMVDARLQDAWISLRSSVAAGRACQRAEVLSAYASDLLTLQEARDLEQHLHTCDVCLSEVMAIRRTLHLLKRDALLSPPASLVAVVQPASAGAPHQSVLEHLGALLIQVATDGLQFLEAALLPEHVRLTVGGHLIPAAAFRSAPGEAVAVAFLDIRQTVRDLTLHIGAWHEDGQTVLLKVQLYKQEQPLARRRVSLLDNGRVLHSSATSRSGEVTFPRLTPGEYTLRIPQEHVETRIILRSAGATMPTE
jgi:anti-sigma factor RsiW